MLCMLQSVFLKFEVCGVIDRVCDRKTRKLSQYAPGREGLCGAAGETAGGTKAAAGRAGHQDGVPNIY